MIANLLTLGNAVCGFVAVVLVGSGARLDQPLHTEFKTAAWLILLGMAFDVLDGRVARTSGTTSDLGAQLDSFADLVTFGVAPAVLVFRMHQVLPAWNAWPWLLWCLCVAYFVGAVLRLARFTAENAPDESAHLCFKGLPSPGAAGTIATLVVFYFYLKEFKQRELSLFASWKEPLERVANGIPAFLPFVVGILGYLMVSNRLRYLHVAGQLFTGRSSDMLVYVIFGLLLVALFPEVTLPLLFLAYLVSAPLHLLAQVFSRRKAVAGADPE